MSVVGDLRRRRELERLRRHVRPLAADRAARGAGRSRALPADRRERRPRVAAAREERRAVLDHVRVERRRRGRGRT